MLVHRPGGFEGQGVEGELQESGALTEGEVLGGSPVDVVDEVKWSQTALVSGRRSCQDVFHEQDPVHAVAAAVQYQTWGLNHRDSMLEFRFRS